MTTVNASWQGAAAYTAPASTAVDASWEPVIVGNQATGFVSTALGSPTSSATAPAQTAQAAGFVSGEIGAPAAAAAFAGTADGFTSTTTGTPAVAAQFAGAATGFVSGQLGEPVSVLGLVPDHAVASIAPTASFGTPELKTFSGTVALPVNVGRAIFAADDFETPGPYLGRTPQSGTGSGPYVTYEWNNAALQVVEDGQLKPYYENQYTYLIWDTADQDMRYGRLQITIRPFAHVPGSISAFGAILSLGGEVAPGLWKSLYITHSPDTFYTDATSDETYISTWDDQTETGLDVTVLNPLTDYGPAPGSPTDPHFASTPAYFKFDYRTPASNWGSKQLSVYYPFEAPAFSATTKKHGTASMYVEGLQSIGVFETVNTGALTPGTAPFTIEAWLLPEKPYTHPDGSGYFVLNVGDGGIGEPLAVSLDTDGLIVVRRLTPPTENWLSVQKTLIPGEFNFLTVCGDGAGNLLIGLNGSVTSHAFAYDLAGPHMVVGAVGIYGTVMAPDTPPSLAYQGYIDEFRFTAGVARYPTNFTPPTAELVSNYQPRAPITYEFLFTPEKAVVIQDGVVKADVDLPDGWNAEQLEYLEFQTSSGTIEGYSFEALDYTDVSGGEGLAQFGEAYSYAPPPGSYTPYSTPPSLQFGLAQAETPRNAVGFQSGSIPTPRYVYPAQATEFGPLAKVSNAYYAFNQWLFAEGKELPVKFGLGYVFNVPTLPLEHQTVAASGFNPTVFGQAQAQTTAQGTATGFFQAGYGTPSVRVSYGADGFTTGSMGNPLSVMLGRASGFRSTVIPAPYGAPARAAVGIPPKTYFGTPKAIRPNMYPAYGFGTTRLGRPNGTQFFGRQVEGWVATVLGTPLGYSTLKARPAGPSARVGRPTLRRTPLC